MTYLLLASLLTFVDNARAQAGEPPPLADDAPIADPPPDTTPQPPRATDVAPDQATTAPPADGRPSRARAAPRHPTRAPAPPPPADDAGPTSAIRVELLPFLTSEFAIHWEGAISRRVTLVSHLFVGLGGPGREHGSGFGFRYYFTGTALNGLFAGSHLTVATLERSVTSLETATLGDRYDVSIDELQLSASAGGAVTWGPLSLSVAVGGRVAWMWWDVEQTNASLFRPSTLPRDASGSTFVFLPQVRVALGVAW